MCVEYFWASTVITESATLNSGSRPASRKKTRAIEDLRAIPWVFSWAQCRLMLPGWYGFGSAVEAWIADHPDKGMPFLKELYREWPFFRTLLSNMDMVLGKSDITIAERYSRLVKDEELRQTIFPRIKAEWQSSIAALLAITGGERGRFRTQAEKHLGRLRSELDYTQIAEIIEEGLHEFIDKFQGQLNKAGEAIYDTFFALQPVALRPAASQQ